MTRAYLTLVPRRTFAIWQRQRLGDIHAELDALRADLKRLQRLTTQVGRCAQCRCLATLTICADGWYRCLRCEAAPKEHAG